MMPRRRSLVSMTSDSTEFSALTEQLATVQSDAAASSTASMARANAAMAKANSATALAQLASDNATGLQVLADQVQATAAASATDRAGLHAALDSLTRTVAGTASAEALANLAATVSGLPTQAVVNGLATAVSAMQLGLSALAARVGVLEARPLVTVQRVRDANLPAVALLASIDRTITWPAAMPSATYSIKPTIEGAAGLGQLSASVKSQSAAGCVITLKAAVAVASNQVLDVLAIHTT